MFVINKRRSGSGVILFQRFQRGLRENELPIDGDITRQKSVTNRTQIGKIGKI